MRYQVIQLIQLLFALSLIFGAFIGGIVVGWWRWGRGVDSESDGNESWRTDLGSLFSPEDREDEVVLAEVHLDLTDTRGNVGPRAHQQLVFGTGQTGAGHLSPQLSNGLSGPVPAIGPPSDQHVANTEALDA